MATVFMKWLETSPKNYDRGIRILTLGRLGRLKETIAREYVHAGMRVLEIGCGTGALAVQMAQRGAQVTAIDASPIMLSEAQHEITAANVGGRVDLKYMDATLIEERLPAASFDLIVSTLVFSELPPDERRYVLQACAGLLAPGGRLLIADEVIPTRGLARLAYFLVRWPLALLTWLLTRTTTHALRGFEALLAKCDFQAQAIHAYLGGSLVLYEASPASEVASETAAARAELPPGVVGRLRHRVTLGTLLLDLWALFFRIIPPYPKVRTGLYAIGTPGPDAPVLVTGNFDLTVRRVVQALDGRVDVWLLVADSAGINVWCASGGGYFTAEKVIAAVKSSHVAGVVNHHALILPQLAAPGVDGWRIRRELGWGVHWGPIWAKDIPAYLAAGRVKTAAMRLVRFPLRDRLEMVTVTLGFYALLILVPVLIFWRSSFWAVTASLVGISYFYAVVHPWLPGRDGLAKSIPLALITLVGMGLYSAIWDPVPALPMFKRVLGMIGLSVFSGAELQGMSPLMRGEQSNWGWEAVIGVVLAVTYWVVPLILGWR